MTAARKADEMTRKHDAERRLAGAAALHTDGERGKGNRMESFKAGFASAAAQAALACALTAACAVPAMAAETGADGGTSPAGPAGVASVSASATRNVTFVCATSDGSLAFSGEKFSVWRVADETGTATAAFSGVGDAGDAAAWAAALATAAQSVGPDASFVADGHGLGTLALAPGKYLVAGEAASAGGVTYAAVPYVMDLTDGALAQDLTSYVKYTTDAPAPTAPDADKTNKDADTTSKASWTSGKTTTASGSAAKTGLAVTGDAVTFGAACAAAGAACVAAVAARKRMKAENEEGVR